MNGLLKETVVRVVLMVKVGSPGRTCIADDRAQLPIRLVALERPVNNRYLLSFVAAERNCSDLSANGPHLVVNVYASQTTDL